MSLTFYTQIIQKDVSNTYDTSNSFSFFQKSFLRDDGQMMVGCSGLLLDDKS